MHFKASLPTHILRKNKEVNNNITVYFEHLFLRLKCYRNISYTNVTDLKLFHQAVPIYLTNSVLIILTIQVIIKKILFITTIIILLFILLLFIIITV